MEVVTVLGPLGSGKTTTVNGLIERVPIDESYAVVVNDVGSENIDARRIIDHPANRSEQIVALTAGCIGCSDVTQFREALKRVHDAAINVLFIEPTGIAPGNEIVDVIRNEGHDLSVLTLVNTHNVARDLKWQVLPSQLAVADLVGLTHAPREMDELDIMQDVLEQIPALDPSVALRLIRPGEVDANLLATLRGLGREYALGSNILHHVCSTDHDHHGHDHHNHAHNHGIVAQSLPLHSGVDIAQLQEALIDLAQNEAAPLLRAKGWVNGWRFDVVGDQWEQVIVDTDHSPVANVIFGGDQLPAGVDVLEKFVDKKKALKVDGDKKSIVKSINESLPVEDRVEIVQERLMQYPAPISPLHGELIPDCEADEAYEICFWGGDDMPESIKHKAMNAYIDFRLNGLHKLLKHPGQIANIDKSAYWSRRYGATLGYNGYYLPEYIADIKGVRESNPAVMLYEGFMRLNSLTFDESRAEEKPEFILSVFKKAIEAGDIPLEKVALMFDHAVNLAGENKDFRDRWLNAKAQLY